MLAEHDGGINISKKRCRSPVFVHTAIMSFGYAGLAKRNTVPTHAILQTASGQVNIVADPARILAYQSAMAQARAMRETGIISVDELLKIEALMAKKYGFELGDLHRDLDMITLGSRGKMPYYEGGV